MGLTDRSFLLLCVGLAVAAPVAALLVWARIPGPRVLRAAQRLGLIAICQVTAVVLVAVAVNDSYFLYASWGELLGTSAATPVTAGRASPTPSRAAEARRVDSGFRAQRTPGGGLLLNQTINGARSRIAAPAVIYLPPEYDQKRYAQKRFPVVVALPGYPGSTKVWLSPLPIPKIMRQEVAARRATPFILVVIRETVAPPRDTECADVVGGPKTETFLAQDLRAQITGTLRARTDREGWAVLGASTGGFCAMKLAMRHPDLYGSAVSISGYFRTLQDGTTGELYGYDSHRRALSSPLWRLEHLPAPPISVLVTAGTREGTYRQTQQFLRAVKAPMSARSVVIPGGGHNNRTFGAVLPGAIDFLSQQFARPRRA